MTRTAAPQAQTKLAGGNTRVSPFSLSRWGPANPHTTRMPGSITLLVRRYPKGTVTPVLHGLKAGDTLSYVALWQRLAGAGVAVAHRVCGCVWLCAAVCAGCRVRTALGCA